MADKIKVIVKRPDELYGHMTNISNTLENMQKIVEGPIETLTMPGYVLILNEEGRIRPDIKYNCKVAGFNLYGTFIVAGIQGDRFADIGISFDAWKQIINESWRA